MITLLAIGFYLAMGGAIGAVVDGDQMKRHVPYGHMPAMMPLKYYRVTVYVGFTFAWLPLIVRAVVHHFAQKFRSGDTKQKGESPNGS